MNIRVLSISKCQNKELQKLEDEYLKRLSKYVQVKLDSLKRPKIHDESELEKVLQAEAELIEKTLKPTDLVVTLDIIGKALSSEKLADQLRVWQSEGTRSLVFIIGGPLGLHQSIKQKASLNLSLSSLTFTHEIARMLLCETLYRSFDLLNSGNYHK